MFLSESNWHLGFVLLVCLCENNCSCVCPWAIWTRLSLWSSSPFNGDNFIIIIIIIAWSLHTGLVSAHSYSKNSTRASLHSQEGTSSSISHLSPEGAPAPQHQPHFFNFQFKSSPPLSIYFWLQQTFSEVISSRPEAVKSGYFDCIIPHHWARKGLSQEENCFVVKLIAIPQTPPPPTRHVRFRPLNWPASHPFDNN